MIDQDKLYAIVDDGNLDGDSAYYAPGPEIEYVDGMTLQDIREAWFKDRVQDGGGNIDFPEEDEKDLKEDANAIKVAWIVTGKVFTAIGNAWPDCGNDGAVYRSNRMAKGLAQELAVKTITE